MKALPILKKVAVSILTALFVSFLTYGLLYISPGDPAELLLTEKMGSMGVQKEVVQRYAEQLGLNKVYILFYRNTGTVIKVRFEPLNATEALLFFVDVCQS